jgi:hypothetical protein
MGTEDIWSRDRIVEVTKKAYLTKNFKVLEELSNKFRNEKSKILSGTWNLTIFYSAIYRAMLTNPNERFNKQIWTDNEKVMSEWIRQYPNSPAAHIMYSITLGEHGWAFRGGDFAEKVPKSAWAPFYKYQELAYKELINNEKVASIDPTWYSDMLRLAKTQGWEADKKNKVFVRGINKEPYYYETYFAFADSLSPKWGGSVEKLESFANYAVQKTRSEDGNIAYARIYMHVYGDYNDIFKDTKVSWRKLKIGFDEMVKKYPDNWNFNYYAKFACLAGDYKTMTPLIKRIEPNPRIDAWDNSNDFYLQCKERSLP